MVHIDRAMNTNHITLPALRKIASKLDFMIDDYKNGDSAGWKFRFDVTEAEAELDRTRKEIELREEVEERDRLDYLDMVDASNGR